MPTQAAPDDPADLLTPENTPFVWSAILIVGATAHKLLARANGSRAADVLAAAKEAMAAVEALGGLFAPYARYDQTAAGNAADTLDTAAALAKCAAEAIRRRTIGHGDSGTAPDGWAEHTEAMLEAVRGVREAAEELLGPRLGLRDRGRLVRSEGEVAALAREAAKKRRAADDLGSA